jgi:hypothetical protein
VVRRSRHYLLEQPVKGSDPILGLATAKDSGMVNIQTDDVSPGSTPGVFVFHLHIGRQNFPLATAKPFEWKFNR